MCPLIADWDLGPTTLTSVTAWRYWDWDVANDRDYTGIPIQMVQRIPSRQDQYSQELRLASNGDGPFSYVAGLYFFSQEISGTPISIYGPEAAYWLLNQANFTVPIPRNLLDGYGQTGTSDFEMDSYAAFGEVNYAFTERLTGTLGLRYTYEDKEGTYATQVFGGLDLTGLPPATAAELTRAKLSIFRPQSYTAADDGGSFSGRANIAYQFTDELFGYVSYAHGYKSGGLNMSGLPLDAQNQPTLATAVIEDETNSTFELGFKSTLLDGRATLNLAAFQTVVEDYQANVVSSLETAAIRSYPSNVPEVRVQGMEADFAALLFEGFTLRASVAYADGENTDYPAGPCPLEVQTAATVACDLTGVPLAGLSELSGTLGFDYRRRMGGGEFVLHAGYELSRRLFQRHLRVAVHMDRRLQRHERKRRLSVRTRLGSRSVRAQPVRRGIHHRAHDPDREFRSDPRPGRRTADGGCGVPFRQGLTSNMTDLSEATGIVPGLPPDGAFHRLAVARCLQRRIPDDQSLRSRNAPSN